MASDRFDNVYLNGFFLDLDKRRKKIGLDSVLPLKWTETAKYIHVSVFDSIREYDPLLLIYLHRIS